MKALSVIIILLSALLSACSSKQMYTATQNNQRINCHQTATNQEIDDCLNQTGKSYEQYERERQEALK